MDNAAEVRAFLEACVDDDPAIVAFYQRVGSWEPMRALRHFDIDGTTWRRLAGARTRLVKRLYAEVHRSVLADTGVYLDEPTRETHFIGTPPSPCWARKDRKSVFLESIRGGDDRLCWFVDDLAADAYA